MDEKEKCGGGWSRCGWILYVSVGTRSMPHQRGARRMCTAGSRAAADTSEGHSCPARETRGGGVAVGGGDALIG
eukprot:CAMPEP_0183351504 /NCGR_PEP_ID=MMETSP0164_2-20130417/25340_1 /TAXON_ID=221442 /ORGANISM="Coccolithus pelagicus ssp braarudi, Strain PLY182g" /LENGTH=73 /DNA_ID=CAMNT_0025523699 /DNA_START=262 /DNA_END=479 /DNA_ORIENTATION=-